MISESYTNNINQSNYSSAKYLTIGNYSSCRIVLVFMLVVVCAVKGNWKCCYTITNSSIQELILSCCTTQTNQFLVKYQVIKFEGFEAGNT